MCRLMLFILLLQHVHIGNVSPNSEIKTNIEINLKDCNMHNIKNVS